MVTLMAIGFTMKVIDGGVETTLSAIKLHEMDVLPSGALGINESLHLIIGYLLRGEQEDLDSKS